MNIGLLIGGFVGIIAGALFLLYFLITLKWSSFGFKLWWAETFGQKDIGFLWLREPNNNFKLPKLMAVHDLKKEIRHDTYSYNRDQLRGATLFGKPFVMFDREDNKNSIGLYYQDCSKKNANPLFIGANNNQFFNADRGSALKDQNGEPIPKLMMVKPSISLPPSFHKNIVAQEVLQSLKSHVYQILEKYKYIFAITAGIGIGIAAILYLTYSIYDGKIPEVIEICRTSAEACLSCQST